MESSTKTLLGYFTLVTVFWLLSNCYPGLYDAQNADNPGVEPSVRIKYRVGYFQNPLDVLDVTVWYLFLYAVGIFGLLVRSDGPRHWMRKPVRVRVGAMVDYRSSRGEVVLMSAIVSLFVAWFFIFFYDLHVRGLDNIGAPANPFTVRLAKTIGHMNDLAFALLLLPVSRHSFWEGMLDMSYEQTLKYHRWFGYLAVFITTLHWAIWNFYYAGEGSWWESLFLDGPETQLETGEKCTTWEIILATCGNGHSWAIPALYIILICVFVTTTFAYFLRRENYELFYYSHYIFVPLITVAFYHSWHLWHYAGIGLALWCYNRVVSRVHATKEIDIIECDIMGDDVTYLKIARRDGSDITFTAGQWMYLNVPRLGSLEWHPFSISRAPSRGESGDDAAVTFHIKNMGPGQWTDRLQSLVLQDKKEMQFTSIRYDGPFGAPPKFDYRDDIDVAVFVAGGIGVTPIKACVSDIYKRLKVDQRSIGSIKKVHIVWTTRNPSLFNLWASEIRAIQGAEDKISSKFQFDLYVSNTKSIEDIPEVSVQQDGYGALNDDSGNEIKARPSSSSMSVPLINTTESSEVAELDKTKYISGRVNIGEYLRNIVTSDPTLRNVNVFGCGPERLLEHTDRTCFEIENEHPNVSMHYHEEIFLF